MKIILNQKGMGIFDLLVTMGILGIIAAIAIPDQSESRGAMNRAMAIAQFDTAITRARAEAVASGARTVFEISVSENAYRVGLDFAPYQVTPTIEEERYVGTLPGDVTMQSSADIIFDPRGYLIDATGATVQLDITFLENGTSYKTGTLFGAGYFEY